MEKVNDILAISTGILLDKGADYIDKVMGKEAEKVWVRPSTWAGLLGGYGLAYAARKFTSGKTADILETAGLVWGTKKIIDSLIEMVSGVPAPTKAGFSVTPPAPAPTPVVYAAPAPATPTEVLKPKFSIEC